MDLRALETTGAMAPSTFTPRCLVHLLKSQCTKSSSLPSFFFVFSLIRFEDDDESGGDDGDDGDDDEEEDDRSTSLAPPLLPLPLSTLSCILSMTLKDQERSERRAKMTEKSHDERLTHQNLSLSVDFAL